MDVDALLKDLNPAMQLMILMQQAPRLRRLRPQEALQVIGLAMRAKILREEGLREGSMRCLKMHPFL